MFIKKYRPARVSEVIGQEKPVSEFLLWYNQWKPGKKAALLVGSAGVGKTCLVEALGNEKNLEIIEINASDERTENSIKEIVGQSMSQRTLFKRGKIFLIDEIDGISGREDRGGIRQIIKLIKESHFPVVLTANNVYDKKLALLKEYCQVINFGKVNFWAMLRRLEQICQNEGIKCSKDVLKQLAKKAEGDMRSALNDLEVFSKTNMALRDLGNIGEREVETDIFEVMKMVFKTKSPLAVRISIDSSNRDPEEVFWWIEQNIPNEYEKPEEISMALSFLAKADLFRARMQKNQEWRLLKYMIDLMGGGVAVSKKEMYKKFSRFEYPEKIRYFGSTKLERKDKKEELLLLSERLHCSTYKIKKEYLPFFKLEELVQKKLN